MSITIRGRKTNNKPKKMGRKVKDVDWNLFKKLCQFPLTNEDIASILDISPDTISRYCDKHFGVTFAEYKNQKQSHLRLTLIQKQIEIAKQGNVAMLIWLGKQYLGQSEKQETKIKTDGQPTRLVIEGL